MAWTDELQGKLIGLDTSPVIYFIEENPDYVSLVTPFFEAFEYGEFNIVTSTITLVEVLVIPIRRNNAELAARYRDILLEAEGLSMLMLSPAIADKAAHLRATYNHLRTADAIQIATALDAQADFFLTNDKRLASVSEIKILVLDDLRTKPDEQTTDS